MFVLTGSSQRTQTYRGASPAELRTTQLPNRPGSRGTSAVVCTARTVASGPSLLPFAVTHPTNRSSWYHTGQRGAMSHTRLTGLGSVPRPTGLLRAGTAVPRASLRAASIAPCRSGTTPARQRTKRALAPTCWHKGTL